jgi:hypothetical protein
MVAAKINWCAIYLANLQYNKLSILSDLPINTNSFVMRLISVGYLEYRNEVKLWRIGNSLMFAIPVQVVDDVKLKAGDYTLLDIRLCNCN